MAAIFESAVLGRGCFWCTEAVFQRLKGVHEVESGYANGEYDNPTYREVSSGLSGYVEVSKVTFDPSILTYEDLLAIFMTSHDPCSMDRQGADAGSQYHSAIFYLNEDQKRIAEKVISDLSKEYSLPIVTEVAPLRKYFTAEAYHQNYYNANEEAGYCRIVIEPKISKLRQRYANKFTSE
jgi:peptide-methionine (S)-S-oxide reductase